MRFFVTGTDTEVGKSAVTACLAQAARRWGDVIAAKPVASGVQAGTLGEDATSIAEAAGHAPLCAAVYEPPVSPHRAILDGGAPVDPAALERWIRGLDATTVLVEGVGGWRVPIQLQPSIDVSDLARWTDGRVILVARDRLGVLNHTLLSVDAIRAEGFDVHGVVLNRLPGDTPPQSNRADLDLLLDLPVAVMGPLDLTSAQARRSAGDNLWKALGGPVIQSAPEESQ